MSADRGQPRPGEDPDSSHGADQAERRRRRAEVFGEVLPDQTRDDRDLGEDPEGSGSRREDWLRGQVPPHHGG